MSLSLSGSRLNKNDEIRSPAKAMTSMGMSLSLSGSRLNKNNEIRSPPKAINRSRPKAMTSMGIENQGSTSGGAGRGIADSGQTCRPSSQNYKYKASVTVVRATI